MILNTLYRKMFLSPYFFTIALRKRSPETILERAQFAPEYIMPATHIDWSADPMLVEDGEHTWLFYEAVHKDRGRIEVAEVNENCSLGRPTILLEGDCHYSYPFVFQWEGTWYMIPESSEAEEVRLYCAVSFPYKWKLSTALLKGKAVDTTVFAIGQQLYMLTFFIDGTSERVKPHAYFVDHFPDSPTLQELPWSRHDELRVRGAGPAFFEEGVPYRPAQISQEQRYGDALAFYKIKVSDVYSEEEVGSLTADDVRASHGGYMDGLHTYCRTSRFEAIDIRCRETDLFKIPKRIFKKFN